MTKTKSKTAKLDAKVIAKNAQAYADKHILPNLVELGTSEASCTSLHSELIKRIALMQHRVDGTRVTYAFIKELVKREFNQNLVAKARKLIKYIVDELDYPTASGKIGRLKWSTLARASFNAGGAYARIARHEAEAKAKIRDNHASLITKFQADGKNELQAQRDAAFTMAQVKEGDAEAIQTLDMAIAKHSAPVDAAESGLTWLQFANWLKRRDAIETVTLLRALADEIEREHNELEAKRKDAERQSLEDIRRESRTVKPAPKPKSGKGKSVKPTARDRQIAAQATKQAQAA